MAVKQFGGITGDLAGWFLQKAELYMLAALVLCQWKGVFVTCCLLPALLYSGKRTFAKPFGGRQIYEVQTLAANAESLPALADELAQI